MIDTNAVRDAVASNIRAARARAQLSQTQVAEGMREHGCKWHFQTVGAVERSKRPVAAEELIALADVLGAAPDALWRVPLTG
jgi:transcriptional regulator with XRE-family HTH domain